MIQWNSTVETGMSQNSQNGMGIFTSTENEYLGIGFADLQFHLTIEK